LDIKIIPVPDGTFDYPEESLEEIECSGWQDPNPPIQVVNHEGYLVVRDDLLGYGSKARFVDYMIRNTPQREIVFGACPATGYAQISLPVVATRYNKRVHLFMAKRDPSRLHDFQKRGAELGSIYHWVPDGMLNVTKARAREYAQEDPTNRVLLPIGLEHPTVIASIIKVAREQVNFIPDHVWSVGSSGTLNRGLQLAWPTAEIHVVSVGHNMSQREVGRAVMHRSAYAFDRKIKKEEMPPYPSAPTYDAKVWQPMVNWYKTHERPTWVLVWNVA
jgi:hypothetical protein